jgi:adenylate cyclase class 2
VSSTKGGATETEVKIRVRADEARALLARAGAALAAPRVFEDNLLFDDEAGRVRAAGGVLRLRRLPEVGVLTFKGPRRLEDGVKSREEIETTVGSADTLQVMLERLGFRPVFRYQKYRETWSLLGQTVVVDETPIGEFVEIEGEAAGIHRAAEALGFAREDYLTDSYVALFFAAGGQGDMVFPR